MKIQISMVEKKHIQNTARKNLKTMIMRNLIKDVREIQVMIKLMVLSISNHKREKQYIMEIIQEIFLFPQTEPIFQRVAETMICLIVII